MIRFVGLTAVVAVGIAAWYGMGRVPEEMLAQSPPAPEIEFESYLKVSPQGQGGRLVSPSAVDVSEAAPVVGVLENGTPRAYLLEPPVDAAGLVVNDLVENVAISVTYCDASGHVRVFRQPAAQRPLSLSVGGYHEGLLLRYRDAFYPQQSELLPLEESAHQLTTWDEWLAQHPETKLYVPTEPAALKSMAGG